MMQAMFQRIESGSLSLIYSGHGCYVQFISPTSTVRIHFTSDSIITMKGFTGTYRSNFQHSFNCWKIFITYVKYFTRYFYKMFCKKQIK